MAQWIRLDTNLPTHDKIMRLTVTNRHRAAFAYVCALAWSGANGTNGHIPSYMLPLIHARSTDAESLIEVGLFDVADDGWQIRNWSQRQPTQGKQKGACVRWHGPECGCWRED